MDESGKANTGLNQRRQPHENPEQHRVVVSQLLDYAKQMVTWNYNQLNEAVIQAARARGEPHSISRDDEVTPHLSDAGIALHVFQENRRDGKFLLLVVGDRIAPNVALLTKAIHAAPGLGFTIALVEMRMYQLSAADDWTLYVVPTTVGRTVEKPRTVVEVRYCDKGPSVNVVNDEDDGVASPAKKLDPDAFISSVPADLVQPYHEAVEQWENVEGAIRFADKRMFFVYELDEKFRKIVRCDRNMISVVRQQDVETWGGSASAFESYASSLESAPSALDFARSEKQWVPISKLSPHDVQMIFAAAISLVQQLKSEE